MRPPGKGPAMIFRQLFEPTSSAYTYLIGCEETREAALIDPVLETVERDLGRDPGAWADSQIHDRNAYPRRPCDRRGPTSRRDRMQGGGSRRQAAPIMPTSPVREGEAIIDRQAALSSRSIHAGPHRRSSRLSLAWRRRRAGVHRRCVDDRRMRPHRFPERRCGDAVPVGARQDLRTAATIRSSIPVTIISSGG